MKIHYLSCHSVLEYDELKLLTELGFEVYANGAYRDPKGAHTLPRPGVPNAPFDQRFFDLTAQYPKTALPPELIEPYDVILSMDRPEVLYNNWDKIKHKRVIWRSIGQSNPGTERMLSRMRAEGLEIVRYSPKERNIPGFLGEDALIRFYKDPEEFRDWNGNEKRPINFTQTLKGRREFCHYDQIMGSLVGFEGSKVYGPGNDDLGPWNGGEISYEMQKQVMKNARVLVYGGTWPACYTLTIIEAMMTGMPVVVIDKNLAQRGNYEYLEYYEVDEIVEHNKSGFVAGSIEEARQYIERLLSTDTLARELGQNARARAIELFGKEQIGKQWKEFLGGEVKNENPT